MARFKTLSAADHIDRRIDSKAPHVKGEGQIVESDLPLDKMFVNKFVEVGEAKKREKLKPEQKPAPEGEISAYETPIVQRDETLEKLASAVPEADENEGFQGKHFKDEKPKAAMRGEEDAPKGGKASKNAKAQESASDDRDVTSHFSDAEKNDFTVTKGAEGFTVKDGKKKLNDKPLKTKKQVEAFLSEQLEDDEEEE